ncbi:outer membrane protein assembly factor BamA [Rhodobaculum claviforme]|uniref:Outer membrane protein assembly factor BamA n=2 Tax=Rhodobaculum claviforme TaxID=1549854 RepID=A0A934TK14_9RHOB|nr:outer membrane protein assembly factor BamA [Rhodobaculum claviforme]
MGRGVAVRTARTLVLGALLAVAMPIAAMAQDYRFAAIQVQGNERVDPSVIAGFAGIPQGETISAGALNAAFQRVVNSGLFEDVSFDPRGGTLVITVRENPVINVISFEGNRRVDDDVLRGVTTSRARRVFSAAQAEQDAAAIAEVYRQGGRFAAEVTPRIIERSGNRLDLVFEIREGATVEIERLSFVGNRAFTDRRLRRVLSTTQAGLLRTFVRTDTFLEGRVELDRALLQDFYLARGYIDFEVLNVASEISREGDAFFVTFTIREGQQYRVGNVSVSSEIAGVEAADFEGYVRVRPGVVFSPTVVEATIARMERQASDRGLRFARVDPRVTRNERNQTVDIDFVLVTGERIFVERIDVQGNVSTLDRVVRREFRIAEGDPLNPRELREAAERIRALGFFSDVQVDGRQGSAPDQVVVDVNVEETTTGSLGFGVSFSRAERLGGALTFSETNFLGRGQELTLAFNTTRGSREFNLDFVEPRLRDGEISGGLSLFYRETDVQSWANFSTRQAQVSPSIGFPVSPFGRMTLRYFLRGDEVRDFRDEVSPVLRADDGRTTTSGVGLRYVYDTRRSELSPDFGVLVRLDQEIAGLGGDRKYLRSTALGVVERRVFGDDVTLRAELEAGAITMLSGRSRVTERFELSDRMRGFRPAGAGPRDLSSVDQDGLGANYFAVARMEADFPLGLPEEYGIAGGVFFDVGSSWGISCPSGVDCSGVDDSRSLRAVAGVSIFWDTPLGPLRFNFSRPVQTKAFDRTQNFDLTIQSRF